MVGENAGSHQEMGAGIRLSGGGNASSSGNEEGRTLPIHEQKRILASLM